MINTPIIDFHAHGGSWGRYGVIDDPKFYIKMMDSAGIDKACINSIFFGDAHWANNLVNDRFVTKFPDRFIGVAFVTPHYPEETIKELDRSFNELNFKFLKLYPLYYGQPSVSDGFQPIFEWANQKEIPIMCHGKDDIDAPGTTLIKKYEKFIAANGIEIAGIEYIIDKNGEIFTYDVNTNTNYNSEAEKNFKITGMKSIAKFLKEELLLLSNIRVVA